VTRRAEEIVRVADLAAEGLNHCEISRVTGIPRPTVRDWLKVDTTALIERRSTLPIGGALCRGECRWNERVDPATYAYLLGLYLGDGYICLAPRKANVFYLRVFLDDKYPVIIQSCAASMAAMLPNQVFFIGGAGCTAVASISKHWPCLFPQHGPGMKHTRSVLLEPWQENLALTLHPRELMRGLIHSDGSRDLNPVKGKDYPRYQFSNRSSDIRDIFANACRAIGVGYTRDQRWTISVARRPDVALLDTFIGPKC